MDQAAVCKVWKGEKKFIAMLHPPACLMWLYKCNQTQIICCIKPSLWVIKYFHFYTLENYILTGLVITENWILDLTLI